MAVTNMNCSFCFVGGGTVITFVHNQMLRIYEALHSVLKYLTGQSRVNMSHIWSNGMFEKKV